MAMKRSSCVLLGSLFLSLSVGASAPANESDFDRALDLQAADPSGKTAAKAVLLYKKDCLAGYGPACTEWGHLRYFADGVPMDLAEASQAYEKGCEVGAIRSCVMLARMKQKGIGLEVQAEAASLLLDRACEIGGPPTCKYISEVLSQGAWLIESKRQANKFEREACKGECPSGARAREAGRAEAKSASEDLKKACGAGDNAACLRGGNLLFEYGTGDDAQVSQMFELACTGGLGEACYARVNQSERRTPARLEPVRRSELLARGCGLKVAKACTGLGFGYASQYVSTENFDRAVSFLRRGCVLGDPNACTRLGDYLAREGVSRSSSAVVLSPPRGGKKSKTPPPRDQAPQKVSVMPIYERACEFETRGGGCNVARVADGFQDGERYLWTCKNVSRDACVKAGLLYTRGQGVRQISGYFGLETDGVRQDPVLTLDAFQTGCDKADARSCGQLASLFYDGKGVRKDEARAAKLWEKNCEDGDGMSCSALGELHTRGLAGFPVDRASGLAFSEKGCVQGWGAGCLDSAWAYRFGDQVPQDMQKAMGLFERGCKSGQEACCNHLRNLKVDLGYHAKAEADCPKSVSSCNSAADNYASGGRAQRDTKKAAQLYEQACTATNAESFELKDVSDACVGAALYAGANSDTDRQKLFQRACGVCPKVLLECRQESAEEARRRERGRPGCAAVACLGGDGKSCVGFGRSLWSDAPHRELALDWISKGCGLGAKECMAAVEQLRRDAAGEAERGVDSIGRRWLSAIRKLLGTRCEAGEGQACFVVADMERGGQGGAVDADGAKDRIKKACELGWSDACIAARGTP